MDVVVLGAGPAGLAIAAALAERGVRVQGIAPEDPATPWLNTYGIWADELECLGIEDVAQESSAQASLLGHRWHKCVSYFGDEAIPLPRTYGLFDKAKLQAHLLAQGDRHGVEWRRGKALRVEHDSQMSTVQLSEGSSSAGTTIRARLVIDATGHYSSLIQRPLAGAIAYQAAYGIVGRFSVAPVEPGQFVMMDYRADHLSAAERQDCSTFLYAMDLGEGVYFVEETSLAAVPAIAFDTLEKRLQKRLAFRGIEVQAVDHVERCLFPMNLPLPDLHQRVVAFGGAASMVHPASGYMVGALLRRAPDLAQGVAAALACPGLDGEAIAQAAWRALWPTERLRKYYLYRFGLECLMRFDEATLSQFFRTFFHLPVAHWSGFLADTLSMAELVRVMIGMFGQAPNGVRWGLLSGVGGYGDLLRRAFLDPDSST